MNQVLSTSCLVLAPLSDVVVQQCSLLSRAARRYTTTNFVNRPASWSLKYLELKYFFMRSFVWWCLTSKCLSLAYPCSAPFMVSDAKLSGKTHVVSISASSLYKLRVASSRNIRRSHKTSFAQEERATYCTSTSDNAVTGFLWPIQKTELLLNTTKISVVDLRVRSFRTVVCRMVCTRDVRTSFACFELCLEFLVMCRLSSSAQ